MTLIRIENIKPGMIIQADVLSSFGGILINAGEVIDEKKLEKLLMHNVKSVQVIREFDYDHSLVKQISHSSVRPEMVEKFSEEYTQKTEDVKDLFHKVAAGQVDGGSLPETMGSLSDDLLSAIDNPEDIFKYFSKMKKSSPSIYTHSINVSVLCNLFATLLDFPEKKKEELTLAGLLHDIGKAELNLDIQSNTLSMERLDPTTMESYRKHSVLGYRILSARGLPESVCLGTLMHHETVQGTGFPTGARWNQIHEFAKILAIADYYDHLTFSGDMKKNVNPFSVIKILENVKYSKFDLNFISTFLKRIATFYQNEWVELSTGEIGQIVFINQSDLAHPIVRIGNVLVDLTLESDVDISKVL